jgi:hypothetical protein
VPTRYPSDIERTVSQWFGPGRVSTIKVTRVDSGFASSIGVESGVFEEDGSTRWAFPPDNLWAQCDIQFRLEAVELEPQAEGLDEQLLNDCRCGFATVPTPRDPLSPYIAAGRDGTTMLEVFIGGDISGDQCGELGFGDTYGLACEAPINGIGIPCPTRIEGRVPAVTFLDGRVLSDRPHTIAHEFGHMLGLNHPSDDQVCTDVSGTGPNNVMTGSADASATLTPQQCERARCIALQWLAEYGRLPPGHTEPEVCDFL